MPIKITLITPSAYDVYKNVIRGSKRQPSLGMAYLAGSLIAEGFQVSCIDADALDYIGNDAADRILETGPDIVGISLTTPLVREGKAIAEGLRNKGFCGHITLGGPHPTALPMETLDLISEADSAVLGEGEETIVELASCISKGTSLEDIDGIVLRCSLGRVKLNPQRKLVENIDDIPLPALDKIPMEKYMSPIWAGGENLRMGVLITSRGCPGKCEFCASNMMWGRRVRYHSVERVMVEIRRLVNDFGVDYLVFNDDTFTLNKPRCRRILQAMKEEGISLPFMVTSRVDTIDEQFVNDLKSAGCFLITYGVESGSARVLRDIGKNIRIDQTTNAVGWAKNAGIKVVGNFMFGHWTDTVESCRETLDLARNLGCDVSQFALCIPYPGSDLHRKATEHGRLHATDDYSDFGYYGNTPWDHPNLLPDELIAFQKQAYEQTNLLKAA